MNKNILKADLEELKTYLNHALEHMIEIEGNPYEAQDYIKDALAKIKRMEEYETNNS